MNHASYKYPTLLDLCRLPENSQLEGHSLTPLLHHPRVEWRYPAITTYGRNNHSLHSDQFHYIQYEDGSEELYDLKNDPNEWHNIVGDKQYKEVIEQFKKAVPVNNAPWAPGSNHKVNNYFMVDQNAGPVRDK